jgi:hypothetical protein
LAVTEFRPEIYLIRYTSGIYSNTKFSLGTGFEVLEFRERVLIYLPQDREQWQGLLKIVMKFWVTKRWEFL